MSCPTVNTSLGKTKGFALPKAKCDEAKQVFAFMGLPFAKPPLGELRFEPPQKVQPWDEVFDATKAPPSPMQSTHFTNEIGDYFTMPLLSNENPEKMSEDCLYLNVFSTNPNKKANMPVLFWIYGGGFNMGWAAGYNGQAICGLNDVVLVVPQYRVNMFGFFTTGKDTKWPGNMGLFDQIMAMEWTRDNISAFGGDPNNVTIFGESAGSISVSMHVTSPMSRGLFHKAISHSGVGTMPGLMRDDLSEPVKLILDELKITATEPEEIVKQLKAMDAKKITKALDTNAEKKMLFPTLDGKFHPKNTQMLLKEGKYNPVPYIIGFNNTEGAGMLSGNFTENFSKGLSEKSAKSIVSGMLAEGIPADKLDAVNKAVIDFYSKQLDDGDKYKWSKLVASWFGDSLFIVPCIGQAIAHSGAGHDTYVYYMTQQPRMHHDDAYAGKIKPKPVFCEADHGDDVMFTMGYPHMNCKFTPQAGFSDTEKKLSKQWMKTICQFAKTGNPNFDGEKEWPKYDMKKFLELKWPYDVRTDIFEKRFKFWSEKIPALLK